MRGKFTFFIEYVLVRGLKSSDTSVCVVALIDNWACLISTLSVIYDSWLSK
jgi:hypothetical protein